MNTRTRSLLAPASFALVLLAACGDEEKEAPGPDPQPAPACFENPVGHAQIINACTDAEKIEKHPVLPLMNADGTLPPLP